jgi:D-sedoheptulose 7-phosphate isomerase
VQARRREDGVMSTVALSPSTGAAAHLDDLRCALSAFERDADRVDRWGEHIASVTCGGGRVLAAGNGGSAAQAQHFTAELVGRYLTERRALSAIALTADIASVTAIGNDYGYGEVFVRQLTAHAREGDVLLLLSTSGRSPNVVAAVEAAHERGVTVYALTGPAPNPLTAVSDDSVGVVSASTPVIQEVHQVAIHLLCEAVDRWVQLNESLGEAGDD